MCYQAEKTLAEFGDKLTDELKNRIEAARRDTHDACVRRDAAVASDKAEVLKKVLQEAGAVIYSQTPGAAYKEHRYPDAQADEAPGGDARPSGAGPRGRVVDADYKESR